MAAVVPIKVMMAVFSRDAELECSQEQGHGAWGKDTAQLQQQFLGQGTLPSSSSHSDP